MRLLNIREHGETMLEKNWSGVMGCYERKLENPSNSHCWTSVADSKTAVVRTIGISPSPGHTAPQPATFTSAVMCSLISLYYIIH